MEVSASNKGFELLNRGRSCQVLVAKEAVCRINLYIVLQCCV